MKARPDPTFEELSATIARYDDWDDKLTIALGNFNRVRAERDKAVSLLREIHDYHCGCEHPGSIDRCVAQPVVVFAALTGVKKERSPRASGGSPSCRDRG